jgi:hypothetical protein
MTKLLVAALIVMAFVEGLVGIVLAVTVHTGKIAKGVSAWSTAIVAVWFVASAIAEAVAAAMFLSGE